MSPKSPENLKGSPGEITPGQTTTSYFVSSAVRDGLATHVASHDESAVVDFWSMISQTKNWSWFSEKKWQLSGSGDSCRKKSKTWRPEKRHSWYECLARGILLDSCLQHVNEQEALSRMQSTLLRNFTPGRKHMFDACGLTQEEVACKITLGTIPWYIFQLWGLYSHARHYGRCPELFLKGWVLLYKNAWRIIHLPRVYTRIACERTV